MPVPSKHMMMLVSMHHACCRVQASKAFYDNKEDLLQLWVHETFRVMGDRMWDPADVAWLRKQLDERLTSTFGTSFAALLEDFKEEVRRARECHKPISQLVGLAHRHRFLVLLANHLAMMCGSKSCL